MAVRSHTAHAREDGQMAVELAIIMPIVLIVFIIAVDAFMFMNECTRFDHLAPQRVLAYASSPAKDAYDRASRTASIETALEEEFAKNGSSVSVSCIDAGGPLSSFSTYICTLEFAPWPFSSIFTSARLEHTFRFTIDPYTPGELL